MKKYTLVLLVLVLWSCGKEYDLPTFKAEQLHQHWVQKSFEIDEFGVSTYVLYEDHPNLAEQLRFSGMKFLSDGRLIKFTPDWSSDPGKVIPSEQLGAWSFDEATGIITLSQINFPQRFQVVRVTESELRVGEPR